MKSEKVFKIIFDFSPRASHKSIVANSKLHSKSSLVRVFLINCIILTLSFIFKKTKKHTFHG